MSFLPASAPNLEQALGAQASTQVAGIRDKYTQARKRSVAQLAHNGQLFGGTADYPLADLANEQAGAESDVYSRLSSALGGISAEDLLSGNDYQRNLALARKVGGMNKPSTLQEILGSVGAAGNMAAMMAAFA